MAAIHPHQWPWTAYAAKPAPALPGQTCSYETIVCSGCGQDWQRIDYGCARHWLYHPELNNQGELPAPAAGAH